MPPLVEPHTGKVASTLTDTGVWHGGSQQGTGCLEQITSLHLAAAFGELACSVNFARSIASWFEANMSANASKSSKSGRVIYCLDEGQRSDRPNAGNCSQAPCHIIVPCDLQELAIELGELCLQLLTKAQQRKNCFSRMGRCINNSLTRV